MTKKKKKDLPKAVTVAVLNSTGLLVGYERVSEEKVGNAVTVPDGCDLPTGGQYKWDSSQGKHGRFIAVGTGFGKPTRPPIAPDYVLFLALESMIDGTDCPKEVSDYVDWYRKNRAQMAQEGRG